MGELGFLGITKPVEYGGLGLDFSYAVAAAEALGHARAQGVGMGIGVQTDMATPALAAFGSDALKREFLAPAIAGEMVVSIGVSEVGAGSDVASLKTRARRDGDDYVISGSKMWITNGTQADWICLLCNTSDGPVHKNKSLIIVPLRKTADSCAAWKCRRSARWACGARTPPRSSSMTYACRRATVLARRAWASSIK
jgi:citronellyl-CoA dehydrogenase